jgi:hypothetical protein
MLQLLKRGYLNVLCARIGLAMAPWQHEEQWSTSLFFMALDTGQLAAIVATAGI